MKKTIALVLISLFFYGCSTSSDSNGNDNTTFVPLAPTNLTGQVISATQINLSWIDNSTNETGFKIERKTGIGTFAQVGATTADVTTFNDTGLTANTTYTYRVCSYNAVGNSLNYSNEIIIPLNLTVTDISGNVYPIVTIGNQTWMQKNLNVDRYRNGDIIPQVTDGGQWENLTTGAWCYYANIDANGTTYGKLYNWYAVNDPRGLAPQGYHIPTDGEWTNLSNYLGGESAAGDKMKATTGWTPYSGITNTNSSGFTALPGGWRQTNTYPFGVVFNGINTQGFFWSSQLINTAVWMRKLDFYYSDLNKSTVLKNYGLSVRCVKDY